MTCGDLVWLVVQRYICGQDLRCAVRPLAIWLRAPFWIIVKWTFCIWMYLHDFLLKNAYYQFMPFLVSFNEPFIAPLKLHSIFRTIFPHIKPPQAPNKQSFSCVYLFSYQTRLYISTIIALARALCARDTAKSRRRGITRYARRCCVDLVQATLCLGAQTQTHRKSAHNLCLVNLAILTWCTYCVYLGARAYPQLEWKNHILKIYLTPPKIFRRFRQSTYIDRAPGN